MTIHTPKPGMNREINRSNYYNYHGKLRGGFK